MIRPYYDPRDTLQRSVRVRGDDEQSGHLFSYLSPEQRVPADHPLRTIRVMTDDALRRLSPRFDAIYATTGRPSSHTSRATEPIAQNAIATPSPRRIVPKPPLTGSGN